MTQQVNTDALAALLSLPMNFTIDPLVTLHSSNQNLFPLTSELAPRCQGEDSISTCSSPSLASLSDSSSATSAISSDKKKISSKPVVKKSKLTLEDKDQKTKERILRNRAAAQESRDKKRRYVADLESTNEQLRKENETMNKRMKLLESHNQALTAQLSDFARQLAELQQQQQQKIKSNTTSLASSSSSSLSVSSSSIPSVLVHGFCDSARIAKRLYSLSLISTCL